MPEKDQEVAQQEKVKRKSKLTKKMPKSENDQEVTQQGRVKRRSKLAGDVPKMAIRRIMQEAAIKINPDIRIQTEASDALQEAAENMLIHQFARCHQLTDLCKMDTLRTEHWKFVSGETKAQKI